MNFKSDITKKISTYCSERCLEKYTGFFCLITERPNNLNRRALCCAEKRDPEELAALPPECFPQQSCQSNQLEDSWDLWGQQDLELRHQAPLVAIGNITSLSHLSLTFSFLYISLRAIKRFPSHVLNSQTSQLIGCFTLPNVASQSLVFTAPFSHTRQGPPIKS